jgi:hypothetical protein
VASDDKYHGPRRTACVGMQCADDREMVQATFQEDFDAGPLNRGLVVDPMDGRGRILNGAAAHVLRAATG